MARTESTMAELGTEAAAFELVDVVSGRAMGRDDIMAASEQAQGLLVMFVCVHCPYVKHVEQELTRLGRDYLPRIAMVAISSNDVQAYPQDGPDGMRQQAKRLGWNFPYLLDETQEVARSYRAACTPDFFLFDRELRLVYRGQLDSSRPAGRPDDGSGEAVTGRDLRMAMDAVLAGRLPNPEQKTSLGCNIKWKS